MSDKPILFSPAMVRALLDGRKSQTRRVLANPIPNNPTGIGSVWYDDNSRDRLPCGAPGPMKLKFTYRDRLYVREAWRALDLAEHMSPSALVVSAAGYRDRLVARYEADAVERGIREGDQERFAEWGRFRQGMHMPRCLSRLTLIVTAVGVQRIQDISETDAKAEGLAGRTKDGKLVKYGIPDRDGDPGTDNLGWPWHEWEADPRNAFRKLWDSINEARGFGWDTNPWVSVTAFSVIKRNIDQVKS
tara:strand:+ start:16267 stop:17004 length:738 start_codon:yes stop_codon:yes gene_type:complete